MKSIRTLDDGDPDTILIARVIDGDTDAFATLVRRHLPGMRAFVAMKLPVPHLADELAHEVFVFAFRHLADFDSTREFRAWLRAIAWNLVRAELQRFAREQVNLSRFQQAQLAHWSVGVEEASPADEAIFLEECLAKIPQQQRSLLDQRYTEGLTPDEMATRLKRTSEWVRVNLFRVRQQLRNCIEGKIHSHVQ